MDLASLFAEYWQSYTRNAGINPMSFTKPVVRHGVGKANAVILPIKAQARHSSFIFVYEVRVLSFIGDAPRLEWTELDGLLLLRNLNFIGDNDVQLPPALLNRLVQLGVSIVPVSTGNYRMHVLVPHTDKAVMFRSKQGGVERVLFHSVCHYVPSLKVCVPSEFADLFPNAFPVKLTYHHERGLGAVVEVWNQRGSRVEFDVLASQPLKSNRLEVFAQLAKLRVRSRIQSPEKYFTWLAQKNLEVLA